jgi:hypothetical protein
VLPDVVLGKLWRQPSHKDTRRLHVLVIVRGEAEE